MDQSIIIRVMTLEDIDQVLDIEKYTFSMPWTRRDFETAVNNPKDLYLVVDKDGEIIGYCGLWAVLEEGQITNVAVKGEYRHQGIGRRMLEVLLAEAKQRGITGFTLEVRESNIAAYTLYKSLGFDVAGIRPGFYDKPKENAIIMWYYTA